MEASLVFSQNKFAINPLVALGGPLLQIAGNLSNSITSPDLKKLYTTCCSLIKNFENEALKKGYQSSVILAARFFLCALIDETILNTAWGKGSEWETKNLINAFQREDNRDEQFFIILKNAIQEEKKYRDALELGFICLKLGFQGKYRHGDASALKKTMNKMFSLIEKYRGKTNKDFLLSDNLSVRRRFWKLPPVWVTGVVTLSILAAIYWSYFQSLQQLKLPIQQTLSEMSKSHAQ